MIPEGRLLRRITSLAGVYSALGRNALSSPIAPGSGPGLGSCFSYSRLSRDARWGNCSFSPDNTRLLPEIRRPLLTAFGFTLNQRPPRAAAERGPIKQAGEERGSICSAATPGPPGRPPPDLACAARSSGAANEVGNPTSWTHGFVAYV